MEFLADSAASQFDEHIERGLACRAAAEFLAAASHFAAAASLCPDSIGALLELGFTYLQAGELDQAWTAYARAQEMDEGHPQALSGLGGICRQRGDLAGAAAYLRRAVALGADNQALRCEFATVLAELGETGEAGDIFTAILAESPQSWSALAGLGLCARRRGDHAGAFKLFLRASRLAPRHQGLLGEIAFTLRRLGRPNAAASVYTAMLRANPGEAPAHQGLCAIAHARRDFAAAIAHGRAACDADPHNPAIGLALCAVLRDAGDLHEAEIRLQSTLAVWPAHAASWLELGFLLRARSDRAAALAAFRRAAELGVAQAGLESATEYLALGRPRDAEAAYRSMLLADPLHEAALTALAELECLAVRYDACIALCDSILATNSRAIGVLRLRARALIAGGDHHKALDAASDLDGMPGDAEELSCLKLEIFRLCGRRDKAEAVLGAPPFLQPRRFGPWFEAVQARLGLLDCAGAATLLLSPPPLTAFETALVHGARGKLAELQWRLEDAIEEYTSAIEGGAGDSGTHLDLARLYLLHADTGHAAEHLRRALAMNATALLLRGESLNGSQTLPGHVLNELQLDARLAAALARLGNGPSADQIVDVMGLVRSHPDATPAALCLMRILRQSGVLASDAVRDGNSIPATLVQYCAEWGAQNAQFDTWAELNPGFVTRRYDRAASLRYLASHADGDTLTAYMRAANETQAADLFRLAYLFHEGGYWIEPDQDGIGPLCLCAPGHAQLVAFTDGFAAIDTRVIGCVPGEAVIARALHLAKRAILRGDCDNVWLATGPGLLTRAFAGCLSAEGDNWCGWLRQRRIADRAVFACIAWPRRPGVSN